MPSGNDVRAGGAFVEAFVKTDKLDGGLGAVNQKVRSSVSIAKSAMGTVGKGSVAGGAIALGTMALVGRSAIAFAKGFATPTKAATGNISDVVKAVNALKPQLNQLKSPIDTAFTAIQGGGIKGARAVRQLRTVMRAIIPVGDINNSLARIDATFTKATDTISEFKTGVQSTVKMIISVLAPAIAAIKARLDSLSQSSKSQVRLPSAQRGRLSGGAGGGETSIAPLNRQLARTDADAHKAAAAMDAFWGVIKRGAVTGFREAFRGGASKSVGLEAALRAGPGRAILEWARQKMPTTVKGALGASVGFALGGPFGAALGASLVAKPSATIKGFVATLRGTFRGLRAVMNLGSGSSASVDKLDRSASKTTGTLQRLTTAAKGTGAQLGNLAKAGSVVSSGWFKLTAIAGGVLAAVSKFSADSATSAKQAATAMGITVTQASRLGAAAELSGSSLDAVKAGVDHLNSSLKGDGGDLAKYVNIDELKAADPEKRLSMVASVLSRIKDPAQKAQASMALLGSTDLIPLMNDFEELKNKANSLGAVLDEAQAESAAKLKAAFAELSIAGRSVGLAFSATIAPAITGTARAVTKWTAENRPLLQSLFGVARNVVTAAGAIYGLSVVGKRLAVFWPVIATGIGLLTTPLGLVSALVVGAIAFLPSLRAAAMETFSGLYAGATEMVGPFVEGFNAIKDGFMEVFGGILDALSAGNLPLAGQIAADGLQVAFASAWRLIHGQFLDFQNMFMGAWDNLIADIRIAGDNMFPGFEKAWSESVAFLADAWTVFVNGMLAGWDVAFGALQKSINYLRSLFNKAFDLKGANEAIDKKITERANSRGSAQDELLGRRDQQLKKHLDDVQTKGVKATLEDENKAAAEARAKAAADAKAQDLESLQAARAKLRMSLDQAKAQRKTAEESQKSETAAGASTAKKGAAEASRKGFEASDIRSKEGLAAIANTARGRSPMDKHLDLAAKTYAESKKQTDLQWKQWKQTKDGLVPPYK